MSAVNEFMNKNKPLRKSKLSDYQYDIKMLLNNRYTVAQIHEFLVSEKVEVSRDYLYRYCQKIRSTTDVLISSLERAAAKPELKVRDAHADATVPAKTEQKKETPVETKESKAETPEEIMARIGPMLSKSRENFTGAKIEEWQPEKKSW